jgi:hypothetical protein
MNINHIFQVFIDNAILHLYLDISDRTGFLTNKHRNKILIAFINKSLKNQRYKPIKKELRSLLYIGRSSSISLEGKLWGFKIASYRIKSDLRHLYDLLEFLKQNLGLESRFFIDEPNVNFICMRQSEVEACFGQKGEQIAPISMTIENRKLNEIIEFITQKSLFTVEIGPKTSNCIFIVIHLFLNNR